MGVEVNVAVIIDRTPAIVWSQVEDIATHVEWMQDAVAIDFDTDQRQGEGTSFVCATRVGPIRIQDHMEITEWVEGRRMGVRHTGLVTGLGAFTLEALTEGRTEFRWEEELVLPWFLGGGLGQPLGARVLERIWKANLAALKDRIEARTAPAT
ncbi:MAG: SRPBCC family protein [Actinomycetia bacterium]|nr:SRPBCC family protein [Actinomycetes bacterium]